MNDVTDNTTRTAAAVQARRTGTEAMVQRVAEVLKQMRREHAAVTVAAVARRTGVSRTFLYQNADARTLIASADRGPGGRSGGDATTAEFQTTWRERALNAEHELKRGHDEIVQQRTRIGELLGQIRDLEHDLPPDGVQRVLTDNHTLKAQLRQLSQDNRRLEERLVGARENNRFLDKRIADLEAELAERRAP